MRSQPAQYKCNVCSQSFGTEAELRQHEKSAHGTGQPGGQYRCQVCGMTFGEEAELREHEKIHEKAPQRM